jgi:hypothetical protein
VRWSARSPVAVTVEPRPGGAESKLTIELDFTGHGIGKLLVPLVVRRQAAREMPENAASQAAARGPSVMNEWSTPVPFRLARPIGQSEPLP